MAMKNILVSGPALSLSGYGKQTRHAIKSLREYTDHQIFVNPRTWGNTPWLYSGRPDIDWIERRIEDTQKYIHQDGGQFDLAIQVCIPNELENMAPINVCYTAGIETTKISPQWIQQCNQLADKVVVVSEFSKNLFEESSYDLRGENGEVVRENFSCNAPVDVAPFSYSAVEDPVDLELDTEHDFNFLSVAQWSGRKNVEKLLRWFVEEHYDRPVGLILKTFHANNSLADYRRTKGKINSILEDYEDRKCSIEFLHGTLDKEEMLSLYHQDEVRAYLSTTHGECFGLPIFEAGCAGLPIVAPDWSGHTDYLYNDKREPLFSNVPVDLKEIDEKDVWEGVLEEGTKWAEPKQGPFKMAIRDVYKNYPKHVSRSKKLKKYLKENYSGTEEEFAESINGMFASEEEFYSLEDLNIEEI